MTALEAIRTAPSRDARTIWMRAAISIAASPEHLEPLFDLVDGRAQVEDLTIDQDMRWALAIKGVAYDSEEAEERVAAERQRDPSDRGQRNVIRAAAARPTAAAKRETWERIHGDGYGSYQLTRAAMQGFQSMRQRELLLPYREPFFEGVREVFATRDHPFARAYLLHDAPGPVGGAGGPGAVAAAAGVARPGGADARPAAAREDRRHGARDPRPGAGGGAEGQVGQPSRPPRLRQLEAATAPNARARARGARDRDAEADPLEPGDRRPSA